MPQTFSDEAIDRIVSAPGPRLTLPQRQKAALRKELNRIAEAHLLYLKSRPSRDPPSPVDAERKLRALAKQVASIKKEVSGKLRPWLEGVDLIPHEKMRGRYLRGEEAKPQLRLLTHANRGLGALAILAKYAAKEAQFKNGLLGIDRAPGKGGDRRSRITRWNADPLRDWRLSLCDHITVYGALASAYRKHFGRKFVAHQAKSGKKDFGPAVRFVRAFFAELRQIDARTRIPSGHTVQLWCKSVRTPKAQAR